ncbi:putative zinc finger, RING/FYVE/PHD-type [Heracleum sosnowskyi]|uniref:Zinc finger, RING/FYVE/PHD-type n=1 Tax=Heracleum sosnowskyi TaxID=360622 RepID=A0AAD8IM25_9APIA|nr:putative zinc finger, RING/FYVE/PHD-type [Heracleum sosnowskyi]
MLFILSTFLFIGIAAVSTIFFLLAISSLHLCRRRRRYHHRRRSMQTILTTELQQHLPHFRYEISVETNKECAVCLESFETGEWCRRLVGCNHVFHVTCVDSWLAKVLNCPVCRAPVRFNSRASLSCGISSYEQSDDEFKVLWAGV